MNDEEAFQEYQDELDYEEFARPLQQVQGDPRRTVGRQPPGISGEEAFQATVQGAGQGLTFGAMDEIVGAVETPYNMYKNDLSLTDAYVKGRDESRARLSESREIAPVITGAADVGGSLLSGYGAYKVMGSPNTFLGSTGLGMTEGALNAAGRSETLDEGLGRSITDIPVGGALGGGGYAVSELFSRLLRGVSNAPRGVRQQQADDLNIELTPAQQTGNQALYRFEAAQQADPGYGKPYDDMNARNQERVNEIAAKTIGLDDVKNITEVEMGRAADNISAMFKRATESGDLLRFDGQWVDDFDTLMTNYKKIWGKKDATSPLMDDVWATTIDKGFITPKEYQSYYSQLGKDLEKARKAGDGHEMDLLRDLRKALDDQLDRTNPGKSTEFKRARDLYKNKLLLQEPGVLRTETGNVSPLILGNRLRRDKRGYVEGKNTSDLYNVARVGQGLKSGIGDSGTATRSKGAIDFILAPLKERVSQGYLGGKFGQNVFGPSPGQGGAINPYINSLMQSPPLVEDAMSYSSSSP